MDADAIIASIQENATEVVLIVGGLLAIWIVYLYLKDEDSTLYKFAMFLGLVAGVAMIYIAAVGWSGLYIATAVIVAIGGFALLIRPFREVHFAVLFALFVMVLVYILVGDLLGSQIYGVDISFIAEGWPRILIAFAAGAIAYMITNFAEAIIKLFGKLLNWWPLLFVLGIICVVEGICVYMEYGSIYEIYLDYAV